MTAIKKLPLDTVQSLQSASSFVGIVDMVQALVENSIDANATKVWIQLDLTHYSIAVRDNGCGIPYDSFKLLGQRHATSKYIHNSHTFGYRGEGLANISNLALVDITSKDKDNGKVHRCFIQNERQLYVAENSSMDDTPCLDYTTMVRLRDIYSRYPVRRRIFEETCKRLEEGIKRQLQARSLAHPDISFQLSRQANSATIFRYPATSSLNQRLWQVYGSEATQGLDFIGMSYGKWSLVGSMSKAPALSKIQHVFVNGRLQEQQDIASVVCSVIATSDYMVQPKSLGVVDRVCGKHPMFVLMVTGDRRHFEHESVVLSGDIKKLVALGCIKFLRKLGMMSDKQMQNAMKAANGSMLTDGKQQRYSSSMINGNHEQSKKRQRLATTPSNSSFPIRVSSQDPSSRKLHTSVVQIPSVGIVGKTIGPEPINISSLAVVGQADKKFIICKEEDRWLVAIDQHAADERIRLEESYRTFSRMQLKCKVLPFDQPLSLADGVSMLVPPVEIELDQPGIEATLKLDNRFRFLGFQFLEMSEESKVSVLCAPTVLVPRIRDSVSTKEIVLSISSWYSTNSEHGSRGGWPEIITETLKSIACRGAVKFNDSLSANECQSIVDRLAQCRFPGFCAHGRKSLSRIAPL